jgi:LacI family transcriptional regulator, galactose operon repressor
MLEVMETKGRSPAGQGEHPTPTIADVANAAGVSTSTAARALGGYGSVSIPARKRVADAARRLGYRRNVLARSMVTGRTQTIGFVGADVTEPFFARALRGIIDVARGLDFEVIVANTDDDVELERAAVRLFDEKRIDGMVLSPVEDEPGEHVMDLAERGRPLVFLDRIVRGVAADAVLIDNVRTARSGVEYLLRHGHRRIALITTEVDRDDPIAALEAMALDPYPTSTSRSRSLGYLAALRAAGLPWDRELIRIAQFSREGAALETASALQLSPRPTAVFATDYVMTLGAYEAVQRSGLLFPEDVSLLGFDDSEWTTIVRPTLTVLTQPAYDIGATAARRLIARLSGDDSPPQVLFLDAALVERDSVAARER